jgi:hypothetical protein
MLIVDDVVVMSPADLATVSLGPPVNGLATTTAL